MNIILSNVGIFDGRQKLFGEYDVLIEKNLISQINESPSGNALNGYLTIDGRGMTLMPGLVDLHVHLSWNGGMDPAKDLTYETFPERMMTTVGSALSYLEHGITSVRDLGSPNDCALHIEKAIRGGKIKGPRIFSSGQSIIMTGGHDPFHGIMVDGPWEALKAVRRQVYVGAVVIKISATGGVYGRIEGEDVDDVELRQDEIDIIVNEAHRRNTKVTAHAIGQTGIQYCLNAGIDCIEHGHCITEKMAQEMADKNISLVPTFYIYQHLSSSESVPEYAREKAKRILGNHRNALRWAREKGVTIGAGSDAGSPFSPHPSLINELIALERGGLTKEEVLSSATYNATKIIGIESNLGLIEKGYIADLLMIKGDPTSDINLLKKPLMVIKNGEIVHMFCE